MSESQRRGRNRLPSVAAVESGGHQSSKGHKLAPDLVPKLVERTEVANDGGEGEWSEGGGARKGVSRSVLILGLVAGALILMVALATFQVAVNASRGAAKDDLGGNQESEMERSLRCLNGFLAAPTIEERLRFVRHPELTGPKMLIARKRSDYRDFGNLIVAGRKANEATVGDKQILWYEVQLDRGPTRTAVFEMTDAGAKLDWESFSFFEPLPWSVFVKDRPTVAFPFRVRCYPDDYFNYGYDEDEKLVCVKVFHPAAQKSFWAYANRDSVVGQSLLRLIKKKRGTRKKPLSPILSLCYKKGLGSPEGNQLWIEGIESNTWFHLEGVDTSSLTTSNDAGWEAENPTNR